MIKLNGHVVTPTIFPDKTSQVWKLDEAMFIPEGSDHVLHWEFESEAEVMHVLQLRELLHFQPGETGRMPVVLDLPYLPYGRQDKMVTNDSTFALRIFMEMFTDCFDKIITLDAHSTGSVCGQGFTNIIPNIYIAKVIETVEPDLICFPDLGATKRGYDTKRIPSFNLDKKRNQDTGEIEGLICPLPLVLGFKKILILDDICDGGRTFIEAAKLLYSIGADEVHLYTTHGLYTKGTDVLFDAGIKRIFNYKGEVKDHRCMKEIL